MRRVQTGASPTRLHRFQPSPFAASCSATSTLFAQRKVCRWWYQDVFRASSVRIQLGQHLFLLKLCVIHFLYIVRLLHGGGFCVGGRNRHLHICGLDIRSDRHSGYLRTCKSRDRCFTAFGTLGYKMRWRRNRTGRRIARERGLRYTNRRSSDLRRRAHNCGSCHQEYSQRRQQRKQRAVHEARLGLSYAKRIVCHVRWLSRMNFNSNFRPFPKV